MRSKSTFLLLSLAAFCATAVVTRGEIAPKSPEQLAKSNTIVVGKINGIYRDTTRSENWEDHHGVVEIAVESVERGENVKPGDIIFARFWNRYWIGKKNPPPYGTGHHLHDKGATVRAHLDPGKGAYEIALPNGLVVIEKEKPETAKPEQAKPETAPAAPATAR
jgi:hypothetical protein